MWRPTRHGLRTLFGVARAETAVISVLVDRDGGERAVMSWSSSAYKVQAHERFSSSEWLQQEYFRLVGVATQRDGVCNSNAFGDCSVSFASRPWCSQDLHSIWRNTYWISEFPRLETSSSSRGSYRIFGCSTGLATPDWECHSVYMFSDRGV